MFDRACLLAPDEGEPLSLVLPEIGDGPLNVVVEAGTGAFAGLEPGMTATLSRTSLQAGPLLVDLSTARTWEPRPDWPFLRKSSLSGFVHPHPRLNCVRAAAVQRAPGGSFLDLLGNGPGGRGPMEQTLEVARQAAEALAAGWAGDEGALRHGGRRMAGLGMGLTPSGDDYLAGVMLRAWLAHPEPEAFCRLVVESAAPRTMALSAAFLRAAARGECNAAWHALFAALASAGSAPLEDAVCGVLAHGHTSGADMLAGFLWGGAPKMPAARRGSQSAACGESAGL